MNEIWKDIPVEGFRYEVSNLGRVRNKDTYRVLKPQIDKDGYNKINLWSNNVGKTYRICRLVAATFLELDLNGNLQTNHKDGIKRNDTVENLEIVTPSQNTFHAYAIGLKSHKGEEHPQSKLNENDVKEIRKLYAVGISQGTLARQFKVHQSNISYIVNQKSWSHC